MSLTKELKNQTIVLLAKDDGLFNPALFNQYWLDSNGIISASEISQASLFSPQVTQVTSSTINFIVLPEQLQIASVQNDNEDSRSTAILKAITLIEKIGGISYSALGVNLSWFIKDSHLNTKQLSKKLFYVPQNPTASLFNTDDCKYGVYFSKDVTNNIRLKLDIKPVTLFDHIKQTTEEGIQCVFNFHSDLKNEEDKKTQIIKILKDFKSLNEIVNEIMQTIN